MLRSSDYRSEITRLQAVVHAATRLIGSAGKYEHILKIDERTQFQLCLLVFKCLQNLAPQYGVCDQYL